VSAASIDWDSDSDLRMRCEHLPWGDLINGTKDQIQRLGIAIDMAFPEEPGGPKVRLTVPEPRGFQATITPACDQRYYVNITFPGREQSRKKPIDFAPGVKSAPDTSWYDEYKGTAESLAAAGLVSMTHLPGAPGMRKVKVTILPDGTIPSGPLTGALSGKGREPGAVTIERISRISYRVCVWLPKAEQDRRNEACKREREEYEARMKALPRPAPLKLAARQHGNVINLREVRYARMMEARKPENNADDIRKDSSGEKRRLLWVSLRESNLLSTIYENRSEEAVRLLQQMTGNKRSFLLSP
jgi:hypothetical protein